MPNYLYIHTEQESRQQRTINRCLYNIHKINYLGHDLFITVRNIESLYFINIVINSICAVQFLKDIYPSLTDIKGGLIGRESFEKIKLDSADDKG